MILVLAKPAAYIGAAAALLAPNDAFAAAGDAKLDEALSAQWQQYKAKFIDPSGRVIDNANGAISHSEGQGYSMLLAERFGDKDAFAKAWLWTRQNLLVRPDRLAAWRWDPTSTPHVTDTNNATDGDLFMAWALSETAKMERGQAILAPHRRSRMPSRALMLRPVRLGRSSNRPPPDSARKISATVRWSTCPRGCFRPRNSGPAVRGGRLECARGDRPPN